jgi:predicted component of type VI protein secretion system
MRSASSLDARSNRLRAALRRSLRTGLLAGLLGAGCCSCSLSGSGPRVSREQAMAAPSAPFAEQAILVQVRADARLNTAQGQAHTLVLGVLQAARADALVALARHPEQVEQALVDAREAPGLLQLDRFVILPGSRCVARVDRARGTLAVALVAGYAHPGPGRVPRVFEIPLRLRSSGWLWRSYAASARSLRLRLRLGPSGVLAAEPLARKAAEQAALPACQALGEA